MNTNRKAYLAKARATHLRDQQEARKAEDEEAIRTILYLACSVFWAIYSGVLVSLVWDAGFGVTLVAVMAMWGGAWIIKNDFGRWPWQVFARRR